MKKILALALLIGLISGLIAKPEVRQNGQNVNISWNKTRSTEQPAILTTTVALPADEVELEVLSVNVAVKNTSGEIIRTETTNESGMIYLKNSFTFKDMKGFEVAAKTKIEENGLTKQLTSYNVNVKTVSAATIPTAKSEAFDPIYKQMAANYDRSYLANLPYRRPSMLIVSHSGLDSRLQRFVDWKRQKGMLVTVVYKEDLGNTSLEIRESIQTKYNNGERYDYLLLIGDIDQSYAIPAFFVNHGADNDVTDLNYAWLEGDDYFPEMLVGRFSVDTRIELGTIVNKTVYYEKTPLANEENREWLNNALVIAGNYAESGNHPVTPVQMSRWLYEEFVDEEYTNVDTVFWYGVDGVYPGTNIIQNKISNGVGMISYRGWGDATGWHYPHFHTDNLLEEAADNLKMTPPVFSIVCNTGDYGNNQDPCFGEAWMTKGSPGSPKGAVAFTGPSFLHTRTHFNNAISSGAFSGILHEGIRTFGTAVTRGKFEVWNQYPLERGIDEYVEFYFQVYNILSDPSLTMWVNTPQQLNASLTKHSNYVTINVSNANNFRATAMQGDEVFYIESDSNTANVYFNPDSTEDIIVTVMSYEKIPFQETLTTNSNTVAVVNNPLQNTTLCQGDDVNITIDVKNYRSESVNNLTATVSTNYPGVNLTESVLNFGNVAAGATATTNFGFSVNANCMEGDAVEFVVEFSNGDVSKFVGMIEGMLVHILDVDLDGNTVTVALKNAGTAALTGVNVGVTALTNALTVNEDSFSVADIPVGETRTGSFTVNLEDNIANGRALGFKFTINTDDAIIERWASAIYGSKTVTDPTGPDAYGYYAYDNGDADYDEAPTYTWEEIDPAEDGNVFDGNLVLLQDDTNTQITLPFNFKHYGKTYRDVTICSNGWISLTHTWMTNFRNWRLPAPLAPEACIAPYWDDLKGILVDGEWTDMRILHYYDEPNARYIIQWNGAYNNANNTSLEKFQVVLYNPSVHTTVTGDGEIEFRYHTVDNVSNTNNYATVGIQDDIGLHGLSYTYADMYTEGSKPLEAGLAIKFTTNPPDQFTPGDDDTQVPEFETANISNYPNPFNPSTTLNYFVPEATNVKIDVYNVAGQKVKTLVNKKVAKGSHTIQFNGLDDKGNAVASGVYFYRLQTKNETIVNRMLLLK